MCKYLFVAAERPLPALAWKEESPGVYATDEHDGDLAAVRNWLTKPFVHDAGSHIGCACPFTYEPDWENRTEADLREWNDN